ncbi:MAG: hypothetical protein US89_C0001G0064 [Candidatus Peregrinibacteria bacterium GW2011_GWF2_38_29]|nr:MAG: hypothetical protein US89_C0001G0064 [Candidatus Peregrinibacteria bacterium GW2011_GWF2_38_29]HBB03099.1 hypothetical protein [Candidatus Peregrinibacteria bacterium]
MAQAGQNMQFSKENLIALINESEALKMLPGVLKDKLMTSVLAQGEAKQVKVFNTLAEEQRKFAEAEQEYMEKSAKAYQDYLSELKQASNSIVRNLNKKVEEIATKKDDQKAEDLLKDM